MADIFNRSFFRRVSLLFMGVAFGILISPHVPGNAMGLLAAVLCFVSVGLLTRYGLAS